MKTTRNVMKTLSVLFLFAAMLSCSKDDDKNTDDDGGGGPGNENLFTFQNENHPTETAFYLEVAGNTSIGLTADEAEDNQLNFLFNQTDYDNIEGDYTYKDYQDPTYNPDVNFGDIIVYLDENAFEDFTEGSLSISKNGANITISYNFSGPSGSVTGYYSGAIGG